MLKYDDQAVDVGLSKKAVENATVKLAQAALINVAAGTGIHLTTGPFDEFTRRVEKAIREDDIEVSPTDLVRHAEAYAVRGAQAMVADGKTSFRQDTWDHPQVCPLWPFC